MLNKFYKRLLNPAKTPSNKENNKRNTDQDKIDLLLSQARLSGDPFKEAEYFRIAEASMDQLWENLIWPMIHNLDFKCVLDLAAGHGRNSSKLLKYADRLIIVDINQECIDICKERFRGDQKITFLKNDGLTLTGIEDESISLVYSFDSMVHFDNEVIKEYLKEFQRILTPSGGCFCHHSNYIGNPGGDFKHSPHWRNFMSKELFTHYSIKAGLKVIDQKIISWGDIPFLDCLSVLSKPA